MKALPFAYHAPRSIDEGLGLLTEHGDEAKVLAGGQSLVPLLNFHLARPGHLVDLNRIGELAGTGRARGGLVLRALARHRALERPPPPWAALAPVAALVGHPAIRARGTVVGSICHADPAGEWPVACTCWPGATLVIASGRGLEQVPVEDLYEGFLTTRLAPDQLALELWLPPLPEGWGFGFAEHARRHGDFALALAAAAVAPHARGACGRLRLVLGGVGPVPVRVEGANDLLVGRPLDAEAAAALAEVVAATVEPPADLHGSTDYRRALAGEMAVRAVRGAMGARGDG
ncbi:MAG TPA: FAD binding domain-containing protein [Acidimicrobiales bacterium]|nr:FAD binding domain-containing protein [Acidimicrobiales bacterium]